MTDAAIADTGPGFGSDRGNAMRQALLSWQAGRVDDTEAWLRSAAGDDEGLNKAWTAFGMLLDSAGGMERDACRAYLRALEINRDDPMTWAALGSTLDDLDELPDAEAAYRQALAHRPDHQIARHGLARLLRRMDGRREEALDILRRLLREEPDAAPAWDLLGAIMEEDVGDLEEAETAYRRSIAIDPTDYETWDRLGRLLERGTRDRWGAFRLYQQSTRFGCAFAVRSLRIQAGIVLRALVLPPILSVVFCRFADRANNRNRYRAARLWARLARIAWPGRTRPLCLLGMAHQYGFASYDAAERAYRKAIAKEPRNEWPWRLLGILLFEVRGRYDDAATVLERATQLDPFNGYCWSLLGRSYEHQGRLDQAEAAHRRAIEVDGENPTVWVYFGEHFAVRRGDDDEALRCYDRALSLDAGNTDALVCKGIALMGGPKDYDDAEACFRQALDIDPRIANAWTFLGVVLYKNLDRADEAEVCLRSAIDHAADYWSPQVHLAILMYSKKGDFETAEAILTGLLNRRVFLPRSLAAMMAMRCAQDDAEGALAAVEEMLAELPDDFDVLHQLAWTVHEEKLAVLHPQAEAWARRAVALQPGVVPVLHTLTELLYDQEKWDEAVAEAEPVYEAVLARSFAASDVRPALQRAAATGHQGAIHWLDRIDTHCD